MPRSLRPWLGMVTLIQALLLLGVMAFQHGPGYTDEAYYALLARRWLTGHGLTAPVVWVYLHPPRSLPAAGFDYWMPLASLWAGLVARSMPGSLGMYRRLQAGMALLALAAPGLSMVLAYRLTGREGPARWAGLLALTPVFLLPYLPAVDAFSPLMVLGAGFFLLAGRMHRLRDAFFLGLVSAGIHLARSEGPVWLVVALAIAAVRLGRQGVAVVFGGYVLGIGPWWARNLAAFGTVMPQNLTRTLWLTRYEDLFAYPATVLTFARWIQAGPEAWLTPRVAALSTIFQTILAVQGGLVWFPWLVWGAVWLRKHPLVCTGLAVELGLVGVMGLVFPLPGARGGFLHALAGLQPLAWAVAAAGLDAFFRWGAQRRGWNPRQAVPMLGGGLFLLALGLTLFTACRRLARWNTGIRRYTHLAARLTAADPTRCPVLVNDAPTWAWANQDWPALTLPAGGPETAQVVARRYGVCWLLLEPAHPTAYAAWYARPDDRVGFRYAFTWEDVRVFRMESGPKRPMPHQRMRPGLPWLRPGQSPFLSGR